MRQTGGRMGGWFGPGERTVISIVTEITIVWLSGWGVSFAWFIGWAATYVIGPLVYVWLQTRQGVTWGVWDNVWGWYSLNWTLLVAWWLVGVPLSTWALVYRFFMEIVFKDWLPHPEKQEVVEVDYQDAATPSPQVEHVHRIKATVKDEKGNGDLLNFVVKDWRKMRIFCKAVVGGVCNFSETAATKKYKMPGEDWENLLSDMRARGYIHPETDVPKKTKKLKRIGLAFCRAIADTPTP